MRTSVAASEKGTQCPELVEDSTCDNRPKTKEPVLPPEYHLPRWDLLLSKRRAIERLEATLHEARRQLRDPNLPASEVDFFATAEAEAREKVREAIDDFWVWNVPDPERRVGLREQARQASLQRRLTHGTESSAACEIGTHSWREPVRPAALLRERAGAAGQHARPALNLQPKPKAQPLVFDANRDEPVAREPAVTVTLQRGCQELVGREQVKAPAPRARLDREPADHRVLARLERGGDARAEYQQRLREGEFKVPSTPEPKPLLEPPRRRRGQSEFALPRLTSTVANA